jgi:hypothetical protein
MVQHSTPRPEGGQGAGREIRGKMVEEDYGLKAEEDD